MSEKGRGGVWSSVGVPRVDINIPIFRDQLTKYPDPVVDPLDGGQCHSKPGHIFLDAMCFGMGSSCVQCTFQCCNVDEARLFYDAFVPLAPIMLAVTANCSIVRGMLTDQDCRWNIIAASVFFAGAHTHGTC